MPQYLGWQTEAIKEYENVSLALLPFNKVCVKCCRIIDPTHLGRKRSLHNFVCTSYVRQLQELNVQSIHERNEGRKKLKAAIV